ENTTQVTSLGDAINGFHILSRLTGIHVQTIGMDYISKLSEEVLRTLGKDDISGSVFSHLIVTGWGEVSYNCQDRIKLQMILRAIENRCVVQLETLKQLQVENSISTRNLKLHYLVAHRGSVFVAATPEQTDTVHFLDVESILEVTIKRKHYRTQLTKQQVEQELASRFGITASKGPTFVIKLGFLPSDNDKQSGCWNPFLEKRFWHANQRFYKDGNGLLVLEFSASLSRELVGWILMWLDHVKVIEPPELIHLIDNKLDDMKRVVNGGQPFFSSPDIF
ncbi:MAG: WYL domain-containing protein, partial [Bacteroidota bacterium]